MEFSVRKLKNKELNRLSSESFKQQEKIPVLPVLDDIRSMNNVGAVFRTCDCLGIGKIYLCGITGTPPHREIHKTALGAEESVEWEYAADTPALIQSLKDRGYLIAGMEQTDRSMDIREFDWDGRPLVLIFGNEVEGMKDELLALCDVVLEIPQFGTKHSFNVAVSSGIALWELRRKLERN